MAHFDPGTNAVFVLNVRDRKSCYIYKTAVSLQLCKIIEMAGPFALENWQI